MKVTKNIFLVGAKRTPFGTYGGALKDFSSTQLATTAATAALEAAKVSPSAVDSVCIGNVQQTNHDSIYLARHVGLGAGVSVDAPMLTVNRLCGSGFQSIVTASQEIMLGESNVVLAGGTESMSSAPHVVRGMRWGTKLGVDMKLTDSLWEGLTDAYCKLPMALTAENLAEKYNITKDMCDEFALRSQQLWGAAHEAGRFTAEIAPMEVVGPRKKVSVVDTDEHPRPQSNLEGISKLKALFKKDGTVSAANASGVCDGAAACVVASESAVNTHGLTPLVRIVSYAVAGVPPEIMGFGPVPAMTKALEAAGLTLGDMDLIEINEAFAAQFLACASALDLPMDKCNVNGGAIALGHPTGASGTRIMGHLAHELQRSGGKYAIGSACIGGGQGIAIIVERV